MLAAHGHDSMEEAMSLGNSHHDGTLRSSSGLAKDGDARGVAAEESNIGSNPTECEDEVEHACIARVCVNGIRRGFGKIEEAESVEAMVDCDDNDIASMAESRAVIERTVDGTTIECTAMKIDQHGPLRFCGKRKRCPDVEMEAVLALLSLVRWKMKTIGT